MWAGSINRRLLSLPARLSGLLRNRLACLRRQRLRPRLPPSQASEGHGCRVFLACFWRLNVGDLSGCLMHYIESYRFWSWLPFPRLLNRLGMRYSVTDTRRKSRGANFQMDQPPKLITGLLARQSRMIRIQTDRSHRHGTQKIDYISRRGGQH